MNPLIATAAGRIRGMCENVMRDPKRILQILATLENVWQDDPDIRLGQLIVTAANLSGRKVVCPELFSLEDEDMMRGLEELAKRKRSDQA
jgi:uncharacterized protein YihD (DUF1040 family)